MHSVGNNATVARDKAWTMPLHVYLCGTVHHVVAGQMNIQLIVDGIPVDTTVVGRMLGTLAWMEEMRDGSMEEVVVVDVPTTGEGLEVGGGGIPSGSSLSSTSSGCSAACSSRTMS